MPIRNLDFLRAMPEGVTLQQAGARLYEAFSDVESHQQTIAQQMNANPTGQPLPPPAINGLTVTGQNGHFHLQVQHGGEFYRGIQYHAEYADNPSFVKPHSIDLGASREHTVSLGNGTYYWRAFAAYGSSPAGPPAYHGGAHTPQPVSGGGIIGPPAFLDPQGSGTGAPGEGLSGPGPIPFRSATGRPPIRGESLASGGSSSGSLAPSPQTGLPEGMASLPAGGSGSGVNVQLISVTQAGLAALAATLNTGSAGQRVYVSDYDHTLVWTGAGWTFASGERSGMVEAFLVDPSPATGWQLCDGSVVTYLKSDGTTGNLTVPNLTGSPSYLKFGAAASGINGAVAPSVTMNSYTPAGTVSQPALTMDSYTPAGTVSQPTFTGNSLGAHSHELPMQNVSGTSQRFLPAATFGTGASRAAASAIVAIGDTTSAAVALSQAVSAGTPAGTVSQPTFTGNAATLTGTVSQPTFTGSAATLTGTASAGEPQNIVLRPWFRR